MSPPVGRTYGVPSIDTKVDARHTRCGPTAMSVGRSDSHTCCLGRPQGSAAVDCLWNALAGYSASASTHL
jgi:hypothetical protein